MYNLAFELKEYILIRRDVYRRFYIHLTTGTGMISIILTVQVEKKWNYTLNNPRNNLTEVNF